MNWLQVHIFSEKSDTDTVTDILNELGAEAVTFQDDGNDPLYEPAVGETPLWQKVKVTGLFPDSKDKQQLKSVLTDRLSENVLSAGLAIDPLPDQKWERTWMDKFHPVKFGERLWICPSWAEPPEPKAINLFMDPGLAFGSGSHPTTAMCLTWLSQQTLTDLNVIDYGCGSGILALAASKLGAKKIWGVDIDPQALMATRNNSLKNKCENIIVALPDQLPQTAKADLIVANILAAPLSQLVDTFWQVSHLETEILLSGILRGQADEVIQAYGGQYHLSIIDIQDDWVLLHGFCSKNTL